MFECIIGMFIVYWWLMMSLIMVLVVVGIWSFIQLLIDVMLDIINVQVQINIVVLGYLLLEIEQCIIYLVEMVMVGLLWMEQVCLLLCYGLLQVIVVFEDGIDIYFVW